MSGIDKLVDALEAVNAPREMIAKAISGVYSDPTKTTPFPIVELTNDCKNAGLPEIAENAVSGEYDITLDEWYVFTGEEPPNKPSNPVPNTSDESEPF